MILVMPMAGHGSRFRDAGFAAPKPLIDVQGKPMYAWAMDGLPLASFRKVVFVCLEEHLADRALDRDIRDRYAALDPTVLGLSSVTEGQACTVLEAREHIDRDEELVIFNADTYCRPALDEARRAHPNADGIISVFEASGEKWSFARVDADGRVLETAEKRRISQWASTGLYHFRRGGDFVRFADAMIAADDRTRGEFYVAPLYNRMIDAEMEIRIQPAEEVSVLGTPEDLAAFESKLRRS